MPQSDILEILLTHDAWATRQMLDACAKLTDAQLHQGFAIGPGSLHDTTLHMLGSMRLWTQVLAGQQPQPRLDQDGRRRSPAELLALLDTCAPEFAAQACRRPLAEMVSRTREGKTHQFTRGAVIAQVLTHGMHHRAQCLNMLRQLGVQPLPPSSVIEWARMDDRSA